MDTEPIDVINSVESRECATKLLNHERNKLVVNTGGSYYYMDRGGTHRQLSGLLPRLRSTYWPTSNIYKQMSNKPASHKDSCIKKKKKGRKKSGGRFNGLIRGTKVHRELKDFVVLDKKNFKKIYGKLHPYCERILSTIIKDMVWLPFLPEFDIYDEGLGIGTSIDMICLDEKGYLILLEFKTGYKNYFSNDDGQMMGHSLGKMRNTMQNQATCQLVASALILEKRYGVPFSQMKLFVIRVDDDSLDIIPIQKDFTKIVGPHIYNDLLSLSSLSTLHKH